MEEGRIARERLWERRAGREGGREEGRKGKERVKLLVRYPMKGKDGERNWR